MFSAAPMVRNRAFYMRNRFLIRPLRPNRACRIIRNKAKLILPKAARRQGQPNHRDQRRQRSTFLAQSAPRVYAGLWAARFRCYCTFYSFRKTSAGSARLSAARFLPYIERIFKQKYNETPLKYVTKKKLELAANLLLNTDFSIEEISEFFSFSDAKHFSKRFKDHFHISPMKYKKQIRK